MLSKKINNIEELKTNCKDITEKFFVFFWLGKSVKIVEYSSEHDTFDIYHEINDTWEKGIKPTDLLSSNIGKAIKTGNFYKY